MTETNIRALLPKDLEGRNDIAAQLYTAMNNGITAAQSEVGQWKTKCEAADSRAKEAEEALQVALADDSDGEFEGKYKAVKQELDEVKAAHKTALEAARAEHEATKASWTAEKDAAKAEELIAKLLESANKDGMSMSKAAIAKALKDPGRPAHKFAKDGESLENADEITTYYAEQWSDFYGKTTPVGADVGSPPVGGESGVKNPWLKDNKNLAEQTRIYREDPQRAVQMAAAAGVTLKG